MLAATPKAIFPDGCRVREDRKPRIAESWKVYLEGLWWSGLRLEESTELHWTDRGKLCVVDLDGRQPMLWIPGELEKGNQDRILPMAPEFAEFLRDVPECEREGYVFNPLARRHRYSSRLSAHNVMLVVGKIGREANVKVSETRGKVKYASAHDLRRSFGERWASLVMPPVLQELMRHDNIQTTMKYYVGQNAKRTSSIVWEAYRNAISGYPSPATVEQPAG